MAWFGEIRNLTGNLTGQLSNVANTAASFTRDVLAEGTEEVSDQGTELKIAEGKIRELEGYVVAQRSENERLNDLNRELTEKAEASELQINTISQQYRNVLQEKHDELTVLKQQQHALQDMQHSMLAATTTTDAAPHASITHSTSTSSLSGSLVSSDEHDFGDVISSQCEINRLSNDVSRLRSECDHWKQMASVTSQGNKAGPLFEIGLDKESSEATSAEEILQLKTRIKELEHNLSHEIDESQRELSALQDAHSHKLSTLSQRHKQEIEDYTQRIEQLEQVLQSGETSPTSPPVTPVHSPKTTPTKEAEDYQTKIKELQEALKRSQRSFNHLDESCKRLRVELEQVKQVEKEKSKTADILRKQVEALKAEKEKGMQENETLRYVKRDLASKLDAERQENARLLEEYDRVKGQMADSRLEMERVRKDEMDPLQEKLSKTEQELSELRAERDQVRSELFAAKHRLLAELDASHACTSSTRQELHEARKKFTSGAMHRHTQLLKEKQNLVSQMIEVGEQVSEAKTSVSLLKSATNQMESETEDMITDLGESLRQEEDDIAPDLIQALEKENQHLRQKVAALEMDVQQLNESVSTLGVENRENKLKRESDDSDSVSQKTLEGSADSETESNIRTQLAEADFNREDSDVIRIQYKHSSSSSVISTGSERTTGSDTAATPADGTSGSQTSAMESSDSISFDGEYDDSIMFSGIKERFPEAAHVLKEQMEHFELIRSDWDMEKQALEEVVVRMREQLKEKDVELQSFAAQKGLREIESQQMVQLEEDLETLQDTIEKMEEELDKIQGERKTLAQDKEALQIQLESLQKDNKEKTETTEALSQELESLQRRLQQAEEAVHHLTEQAEKYKEQLYLREEASFQDMESLRSSLQQAQDAAELFSRQAMEHREALEMQKEASMKDDTDRDRMEADLLLLNQQHQQALDQILQSRDQIKERAENLEKENAELLGSLSEKEVLSGELGILKNKYEEDVAELRKELDRRKDELSGSLNQEKEEEDDTSVLRQDLEDSRIINKKLEDANTELNLQVNDFKVQFESLEKELKALKDQASSMIRPEIKNQLESSVAELKNQLQVAVSNSEESKSKVKDCGTRIRELEATVENVTSSRNTLKSAYADSREKLEMQIASSEEKSQLLANYEDELDSLKRDRESLLVQIQQTKQQHDKTMQELTQSRELDTSTLQEEHEKLIQLKNAKETEVMKLKSEFEELQSDLSGTKDMLNSTLDNNEQLTEILKNKEDDIKNLAEENSYFFKAVEEGKTKEREFGDVQKKIQENEGQLAEALTENAALVREVEKLKQDLKDQMEHSSAETKTLELITELEGELQDLQQVLNHKEDTISSLQDAIKEKQSSFEELEERSGWHLRENEKLQIENSELKSKTTSLDEQLTQNGEIMKSVNEELQKSKERLVIDTEEKESASSSQSKWIMERDNQILELSDKLSDIKDEIQHQEESHAKNLNEKNLELSLLKDKLEKLRQELDFRQRNLAEVKADHSSSLNQKNVEIAELTEKLEQLTQEGNSQNQAPSEDKQNGIIEEEVIAKRASELQSAKIEPLQSKVSHVPETISQSSLSDNEKHLENIVKEKEKEISLLKGSNLSLTNSLKDKSLNMMGNTILVDLHKLQMQVRTYDSERSQMMTVLNEKTRECSNLKNEVHRLVKVISAQKTALEKEQDDSREIQRRLDKPQDDMQKQALQKLSRLIQDKDLEIEALKQKNDTLLEVLQSSEPNSSSDISRVLGESEKLQKENKMLKEGRDQLVVSIHQKHNESLTYYEEVQRLVGVVQEETRKQSELQQKYNTVYADLDDQVKSLSQLQIDMQTKDTSLANLQERLGERDQSVLDLESQLSVLNETFAEQTEELQEALNLYQAQQGNEDLSALLGTKEGEISDLKSQIEALNNSAQVPKDSAACEEPMKQEFVSIQTAPPHSEDTLAKKESEITKLKEKLDHNAKVSSNKDSAIKAKQDELQHKLEELASLRQETDLQDQFLLERDAALQLKNHQLQTLTNETKSKDVELHSLQRQNQTLLVQLQGFQTDTQNLKKENQMMQHAVHNKDGENRTLQDTCNRLAAQLREKDFEIGALKEKNLTLTSLVQKREEGTSGELQRLLGETEAMQKQAQMFQQERDQALLALDRHQADIQAMQHELLSSRDREQRLVGELERLRGHLLQVEEGYTREALQGEEREKELRNRLAVAEDAARTSTSAVHSASKEASNQIESLLDQLHSVTSQKDQALLQLGEAQEQVQQYSTSLANLQMVLEQFTQEKEAAIAADVERYEVRAEEKSKVAEQLFKKNMELQERLASTTEALEAASRLNEQLDRKEEVAVKIQEELSRKEELLHEYEGRFAEMGNANETRVDKPLMKNLIMGYFHAPQKKRPEVLKLLGNMLNFTQEEMEKIGVEGSHGGWLSSLWGRGTPVSTPPSTPHRTTHENSFSEQFVKFLQHESSPAPKLRLPIDEMTQDKPRSPRGKAFNPFSAPVPHYSPYIQQHRPLTPAGGSGEPVAPMLAPKTVLPTVPAIAPVIVPDLLGGNASTNKGASMGLKEILQQ